MKKAIYPGSFDPVTNGHIEIIRRASDMFDQVIVLISVNPNKHSSFTVNERADLLRRVCYDIPNVRIDSCSGLIVDYFKEHDCDVIVKGLRAMSDFENEFQMAHVNKHLCPRAETVFLCADSQSTYLSSSMVKQIATFGGDISPFVPEAIKTDIIKRLDITGKQEDNTDEH
ncbi:MAG: pantetheine-phosphate adenylyltransferase [Ruminiclostridium sp.]|nr:pantetheine-phosphate adenylyltransferase [Ruminiclostridium sp.]